MLAWFDEVAGEGPSDASDDFSRALAAGRAALLGGARAEAIVHFEAALGHAAGLDRQVQAELLLAGAHVSAGELGRGLEHARRAAALDERADTRERKGAPGVTIARILAAWAMTGFAPDGAEVEAWTALDAAIAVNPRWYDVALFDPALAGLPAMRPALRDVHRRAVDEVRKVRGALDRLVGELGPPLSVRVREYVEPLERALLTESYRELRGAPVEVRRGVRSLEDALARGFGRASVDARKAAADAERQREQDRRRRQVALFDEFFRQVGASELS